jgi:hypothetical protein
VDHEQPNEADDEEAEGGLPEKGLGDGRKNGEKHLGGLWEMFVMGS